MLLTSEEALWVSTAQRWQRTPEPKSALDWEPEGLALEEEEEEEEEEREVVGPTAWWLG